MCSFSGVHRLCPCCSGSLSGSKEDGFGANQALSWWQLRKKKHKCIFHYFFKLRFAEAESSCRNMVIKGEILLLKFSEALRGGNVL